MERVLKATGIKKVYGSRENTFTAIHDMDLQIARGEFVGIMGPSGSGKSTLLNILTSIDSLTSGTVKINNHDLVTMKEQELANFRRDQLGFIFKIIIY